MGDGLKDAALAACVAVGRRLRRAGVPVLAYHSVDETGSYMSTPPDMFREQMAWLREHGYRALSMRQLVDEGRTGEKAVVLTFDDGLANFADTVWPVLRDLSFSATTYVPTAFVGTEAAWYLRHGLPHMPCMSWDALRAVHREGADVESHAHTHRDLTALSPAELRDELRRSKAELEDGLGAAVQHLAYPFGAASAAVREATREAGYRTAVALTGGRWHPGADAMEIPRQDVNLIAVRSRRTARLSIEACAQGTFSWYTGAKTRLRAIYATPPHRQHRAHA